MKKWLALIFVVGATLGLWAGFSRSAVTFGSIQAGLAMVIGTNLLFCLWVWYRAKPGSGDATVMPILAGLMALMLLGILPRLFWPAATNLQFVGQMASFAGTIVILVIQFRRLRRLRRNVGAV